MSKFPTKGTTVWVNFRGKSYLGKVIQTSIELDMVCVRISNYFDHVQRDIEEPYDQFPVHSCPDSKPSFLTNRPSPSSIVITCGHEDIEEIDVTSSSNNKNNSDIIFSENPSKKLQLNCTTNDILSVDLKPNSSSINPEDEDEREFSESFRISQLLQLATEQRKEIIKQNTNQIESQLDNANTISSTCMFEIDPIGSQESEVMWQCNHCSLCMSNENDINSHVINVHKLDSLIEMDNWIVIGGIKGLDYDEIHDSDDSNIQTFSQLHLSSGSIKRKRQLADSCNVNENESIFYQSTEPRPISQSTEQGQYSNIFGNQSKSPAANVNLLFQNSSISYVTSHTTSPISQSMRSDYKMNITPPNLFSTNQFNLFHQQPTDIVSNVLLRQHYNNVFPFPHNNSYPNELWNLAANFNKDPASSSLENTSYLHLNQYNNIKDAHFPIPAKRTRLESSSNVKKCRKMYGIDQRHLWCNQCKWKKACTRFTSENSNNNNNNNNNYYYNNNSNTYNNQS